MADEHQESLLHGRHPEGNSLEGSLEESLEDVLSFGTDGPSRPFPQKLRRTLAWVARWSGHVLVALLVLALFLDVATRRHAQQQRRPKQPEQSETQHIHHHHHHHHPDYNTTTTTNNSVVSCDCGKSVAEARLRGCQYDTLAASWLPDACRDDELSRAFDRAGPGPAGVWIYYADAAATRVLTIEQVAALPDQPAGSGGPGGDGGNCFWVARRWHLLHCTFYWKKLFRQAATGVVMERHYNRMGHIEHCEALLVRRSGAEGGVKGGGLDDVVTQAAVGLSGDHLELGLSGGCPSDRAHGSAAR